MQLFGYLVNDDSILSLKKHPNSSGFVNAVDLKDLNNPIFKTLNLRYNDTNNTIELLDSKVFNSKAIKYLLTPEVAEGFEMLNATISKELREYKTAVRFRYFKDGSNLSLKINALVEKELVNYIKLNNLKINNFVVVNGNIRYFNAINDIAHLNKIYANVVRNNNLMGYELFYIKDNDVLKYNNGVVDTYKL